MKDTKRQILKQLLRGYITTDAAAIELSAKGGGTAIVIVVQHPNGLYSIGADQALTQEQVKMRTERRNHVIVDEESAKLGSA